NGAVSSRHIIIFAGQPDSRTEFVVRNGAMTVPATAGQKERFSDVGDRDQIQSNFVGQAHTTVSAVGGNPGAEGWDYPGDLEGLHKAIKAAGEAIEASADPSKEQFILFVTDHGLGGVSLAPAPRMIPRSTLGSLHAAAVPTRITIATNVQPFLSTDPLVNSMLRSPDNQPGLQMRVAASGPIEFPPGAVSLELKNEAGTMLVLDRFITGAVDL